MPQGNLIAPFGFTGELQDSAGMVHLRARWYDAGAGRFHARDPFAGWAEQPYSTHYYQYAYSDPVFYTDPSGLYGDPSCRLPSTMQGPPRCPQPDYVHPFIYNMLPHNAVFLTPLAAEQFRSEVLAAARHELQAQRDQEIVFYSVAGTALTACSGLAVIDVPTKLATAIMIIGTGIGTVSSIASSVPDQLGIDPLDTLAALRVVEFMEREIDNFERHNTTYSQTYRTPLDWTPYMAFYTTMTPPKHHHDTPKYLLHSVQVRPVERGKGDFEFIAGMQGVQYRHRDFPLTATMYHALK